MKSMHLPGYNYIFNQETGFFARWGNTMEEDPTMSPIGPEILDIEVSEVCSKGCKMCYKSNVSQGKNMSLDSFKTILDRMPSVLQVAFGIGDVDGNDDLFPMMEYCRSKGVVPNVTINGYRLTDEIIDKLSSLCGAVAVSNYSKNSCYGTVKKLTDKGMKQINIHQLLSAETEFQIFELIEDIEKDDRLAKLNAVVFLSLKQKGRGETYHRISDESFKKIIDVCMERKIRFGFDSCSACKFTDVVRDNPEFDKIVKMIEPCESSIFSSYVNVDGNFYPCSFAEKGDGISVLNCDNFLKDVWFNEQTVEWRKNLLYKERNCPLYEI